MAKKQKLFIDVSEALYPDDAVEAQVNRMKINLLKVLIHLLSDSKISDVKNVLDISRTEVKMLNAGRVDAFTLEDLIRFSVAAEALVQGRVMLKIEVDVVY